MFTNVGSKIKSFSKFMFWTWIIINSILAIYLIAESENIMEFVAFILCNFTFIPSFWLAYGIGILIENSETNLQIQLNIKELLERRNITVSSQYNNSAKYNNILCESEDSDLKPCSINDK